MEDLASFIQSMSEKYGLLDTAGNNKIGSTTSHRLMHNTADTHQGIEQEEDLGLDTNWECLSTFLNSNTDQGDHEPSTKHEVRKKSSQTSKRITLARKLLQQEQSSQEEGDDDDDDDEEDNESASSARTSMKTSDLLHNASFLDELQNPSLSDDLRSTGMTHGRTSSDSVDKENDHCSGQSSLLVQEFLTNAGEEDLDEVEFAQEMGIQPQKDNCDARSWQTSSQLWFQDYCSAKQSAAAKKSFSERPLGGEAPKARHGPADHHFKDRGGYNLAHDILLSSGSSTSPGTELDSQVAEDCHSAAASDCGAPAASAAAATAVACGSRCETPDDFAAAVESVEKGRESAVLVSARVDRMLEDNGASHRGGAVVRRSGATHVAEENGGGTSSSSRIVHEEFFADVRVKDLSNGSLVSVARQCSSSRVADIDEASKLLLVQLDKSRSLLGPSTPNSSSSMRRSPSLQQTTRPRQPRDPDICHSGGGLDEVQGCRSEEEDQGVSPRSQRTQMSPVDPATAAPKGQQEYDESKRNGHSSISRCHEGEYDSRNQSPTCQQDDFVARAFPRDRLQADPNPSGRHQQNHHQSGRASFPRSENHDDAARTSPRHPEYEGKRVSPGHQVEEYYDVWRYSSGYEQDDHSRASPSHQHERVDHGGRKSSSRKHLNHVREEPEVEVNSGYEVKGPSPRNQLQDIDRRRILFRDSQAKHSPEPRHAAPADHERSPSSEEPDDLPGSHAQSYGRGIRMPSSDKHSNGIHERQDLEAGNGAIGHPKNYHKDEKFFTTHVNESANYYQDNAKPWEKAWNELEDERGVEEEEELRRPVESNNPVECHSKWERINDLLCQNGFPPVRSPSSTSEFEEEIYLVLSEIVTNYERREKLVQALLEESEDLRQGEERLHSHMQQLESERDEMKQNLAACEQRAEVASETAERNCAALRRDCQKLESSNANLMQRCRNSQLEHACRAKERTLQKLQDKVRVSMEKEERHRTNDKEAYEKLKHKVAATQRTNGEALEPNFLQRDLKPAQIVGVYERQKVALENEIATLRAENGQLCRDLCEKENLILNKVLGTEETKKAFEILNQKHQSQQMEEKEKEIRRLQEELKARPTVEVLEERFRVASYQLKEPHHFRNDHRRNIGSLERILQQICQLLELDEPGSILETLESLLLLVSAVPRMEQFVGDVCNIIFIEGQNWILSSNGEDEVSRTPDAVPGILQTWLQKLESSSELLTFKESIMRMLWERDEKSAHSAPKMSNQAALECVKNLIDVENDYLLSKASYRDADAIVKAEPEKLLHRVLDHFQMLFEVPQLEGVMAVMNSVYIQCSEYHNFARALCSMLGLEKEAGPNTIISAVNSILSNRMM